MMILFVDDEKRKMHSYYAELEYELPDQHIMFKTAIDDTLQYLEVNSAQIQLLILDIMMPPGQSFKNVDTESGLRTGIHFFERIREKIPDLPVIIFTNVPESKVAGWLQQQRRCWFLQKENYFPFELAEIVKKILSEV